VSPVKRHFGRSAVPLLAGTSCVGLCNGGRPQFERYTSNACGVG
jgi:hypothetical protein